MSSNVRIKPAYAAVRCGIVAGLALAVGGMASETLPAWVRVLAVTVGAIGAVGCAATMSDAMQWRQPYRTRRAVAARATMSATDGFRMCLMESCSDRRVDRRTIIPSVLLSGAAPEYDGPAVTEESGADAQGRATRVLESHGWRVRRWTHYWDDCHGDIWEADAFPA